MESTEKAEDLAKEIGLAMVGPASDLVSRLQSKIREEEQEKARSMIAEEVDKALAFYAPEIRGAGTEHGGTLRLDGNDRILAQYASLTMQDGVWYPVSATVDSGGRLSEDNIRKAVSEFLAGGPVNPLTVGSDEEIGILLSIMESCGQKATIDPHAVAAVRALTNYTCGSGVHVNCSVDEIDTLINQFIRRNAFQRRVRNAVSGRFIFGEHFFFYYINPNTGEINLRDKTRPYEIVAIQTHPEDCETRLAYGRTPTDPRAQLAGNYEWHADINYWDQRQMSDGAVARNTGRMSRYKLVQMVKSGPPGAVRGIPRMYPVLRYHRYYEDFIVDRVVLNHERTKIVWIRKISGNQPITGRNQYSPAGGQILTETPQIAWRTESPKIDGSQSDPDARMLRLTIASGWGIPEHIMFQDASQQVYASIRSQDTPFSSDIRAQQTMFSEDIEEMFRVMIREYITAGRLKPTIDVEVFTTEALQRMEAEVAAMLKQGASREEIVDLVEAISDESPMKTVTINTVDVKVDVQFPEVVRQDPLQMAQETEVLDRVGLFSKTELAARHGGNYRRSAKMMMIERGWSPSDPADEPKKQKDRNDQKRNAGRGTFGKPNEPKANDEKEG